MTGSGRRALSQTRQWLAWLMAFVLVVSSVCSFLSLQPAEAAGGQNVEDDEWSLTIMHTNDTHSHLDDIARRATLIRQVRDEVPHAVLLDAGDVFSGTLYFTKWQGQADLDFMNALKYDLMTFGNHEFDKGSKVLADFIRGARFPFVSSNVEVTEDHDLGPLVQTEATVEPGKIHRIVTKEIDGETVGFIGLTTEDTRVISSPSQETRFHDVVQSAREAVDQLTQQGIDKIVVVTHIGYEADRQLAKQVEGIDVIVGGHSHTKLEQMAVVGPDHAPTLIVQTGANGENLGRLDVVFDKAGRVLVDRSQYRLLPVEGVAEDPEIKARIDTYKAELDQFRNEVVGRTAVSLDGERAHVRTQETNLGNLIADSMRWKANRLAQEASGKLADMAITNGGGIRASIQEGPITLGDVLTVMPFGNTLAVADLTGAQVVEALENGVSQVNLDSPGDSAGRFPQVSGLNITWDPAQPAGKRIVSVQVEQADGTEEPIRLDKTYRVVTNGFMLNGGDGYATFLEASYREDLGYADYEVLIEYIVHLMEETKGPIHPRTEGRIAIGSKDELPPSDGQAIVRVAGKDRYATSIALSEHIQDHSLDAVILASGRDFPDAMAGGTLVQSLNGTVLLFDPKAKRLNPALVDTVQRVLKPNGRIVLLGGPQVIPATVEQQVKQAFQASSFDVERVYGKNRQETAVKVAAYVNPSPREVFLVSGNAFADALSIVPYANQHGIPVLLNRSGKGLDAVVEAYLTKQKVKKVTIVGGPQAVPGAVTKQLINKGIAFERTYGQNRFATSLAVAEKYHPPAERTAIVNGLNYPDGLSVSRFAYDHEMPVLLSLRDQLPPDVQQYVKQSGTRQFTLVGGPHVLSDKVLDFVKHE